MESSRNWRTFVDVLSWRAARQPEQVGYIFLRDGEDDEERLTFQELDRRARAIGAYFRERTELGGRVLLVMPSGLEYVAGFFGCLYAGVVAVTAHSPRLTGSLRDRDLRRLEAIAKDANPSLVLSTRAIVDAAHKVPALGQWLGSAPWTATEDVEADRADDWTSPDLTGESLAFLQYTSGSTASPKGVMVRHGNLLHNQEVMARGYGHNAATRIVSWLPLFHDMGLIGQMLHACYLGGLDVFMSPEAFVQKPSRWLRAMTKHGGTSALAPNFGYELCVKKVAKAELESLDLRSWTTAGNASEPVHAETLDRFAERFSSVGFAKGSFVPSYGLAEATLIVTAGGEQSPRPTVVSFSAASLDQRRYSLAIDGEPARRLVGCGRPVLHEMLVVDPETRRRCEPGSAGEIWIRGGSVAAGYWQRPEETQATFAAAVADDGEGPYLRTGDLGFLHDGQLYIAGRIKDLIIFHGVNYYPQDVERTAEACHPAVRAGCCAAFSVDVEAEERLVLVLEVDDGSVDQAAPEIISAVRRSVADEHSLGVYAVVLIPPRTIWKTTSGKIQRSLCRAAYLQGDLPSIASWRESAESSPSPHIESIVREIAASVLGVAPSRLDRRSPLADYGLDSVAAVSIAGELSVRLGVDLSPTKMYDHPSISDLAECIAAEESLAEDSSPTRAVSRERTRTTASEAIAIVSISCRFPDASSPTEFWSNLLRGVDSVRAPSPDRATLLGNTTVTPWRAGWLEGVDQFDAEFFAIAPQEARSLDPQQRILLEVCEELLESAAAGKTLGPDVGVFIGASLSEYLSRMLREPGNSDGRWASGSYPSILANRLSYQWNWRGPSLAVDAACSSSLVALHLAAESLRRGECQAAVAGGAQILLEPRLFENLREAGMLSPEGVCRTFDDRADGYVRGEGIGLVLLKRLEDAQRDGDFLWAVLRGTAVAQEGKTNGLTAPSAVAQAKMLRKVYRDAKIEPHTLGLLEAHGTGTALGDPIELEALAEVFAQTGPSSRQACAIGSVKTNLGHLEPAAGVAGFLKAVLALHHRVLPPSLHFEIPNRHWRVERSPFFVVDRARPWRTEGEPRRAGVSSFGFGGAIAHAVLEEAPAPVKAPANVDRPMHLLCLSAKKAEVLRELVQRFAVYLRSSPSMRIADVAYSANTGRASHPHRMAVRGKDAEALAKAMEDWLDGRSSTIHVGFADADAPRPFLRLWIHPAFHFSAVGRELLESSPTYRSAFERIRGAVDSQSLNLDNSQTNPTTQFVVLAALVDLLRFWGIEFDEIGGSSVARLAGEYLLAGESIRVVLERLFNSNRQEVGAQRPPALGSNSTLVEFGSVEKGPDRFFVDGESTWDSLTRILGRLFVQGAAVRFQGFDADYARRKVPTPTYPFQRRSYWFTDVHRRTSIEASVPPKSIATSLNRQRLESTIIGVLAEVAGWPIEQIRARTNFRELGIDSLLAARAAQKLAILLKLDWEDASLLFAYPTVESLAKFLEKEAKSSSAGTNVQDHPTAPIEPKPVASVNEMSFTSDRRTTTKIAVIGMSCRFPGSPNIRAFWKNLCEGVDAVGKTPADRIKLGAAEGFNAGWLQNIADFDAAFFNLSGREARLLDPQHRLFLETAWEAVESAGYRPEEFSPEKAGVFIGISSIDYLRRLDRAGVQQDPHVATGNLPSMIANRASYFFQWRGPSVAIDTACSASLVAVHLACQSLRTGDATVALAGGVNLILNADHSASLSQAGMLSASGRCQVFDEQADGYVRGEGAAALLLKPLETALRDGDHILAVIDGSAVNHDGGEKLGFTAPNPRAQSEVYSDAHAGAKAPITYLEAHGTGTPLGDPIEMRGLVDFFGNRLPPGGCAIGSVKTNIGHLEAAAGAAGLIKVILMLGRRTLVPSLHLGSPNHRIDFTTTPFYWNDRLRPWLATGLRRAGVSSFGAGGTNAHVVIEEAPLRSVQSHRLRPELLTLSARSSAALEIIVADLIELLGEPDAPSLTDLCHTLNRGRRKYSHRLAVVARSSDELASKLMHWQDPVRRGRLSSLLLFSGEFEDEPERRSRRLIEVRPRLERLPNILLERLRSAVTDAIGDFPDLVHGEMHAVDEESEQYLAALAALGSLFCAGATIDWNLWEPKPPGRRALAPGHPFDRKRYWVEWPTESSIVVDPMTPAPKSRSEVASSNRPAPASSRAPIDAIRAVVLELVARALELPEDQVSWNRAVVELGVTSVLAVELALEIGNRLQLKLPPGVLFEHSNLASLSNALISKYGAKIAAPTSPPLVASEPRSAGIPHEPIAVIGMSGRFPGGNDLDEFWKNLAAGVDSVTEAPSDRWDVDEGFDSNRLAAGKSYSRWGGFLTDVDQFDAPLFRISPREAREMDPQQRLALETAWETFENGGRLGPKLSQARVGVFVGAMASEYKERVLAVSQDVDRYAGAGTSVALVSNRISYAFDLHGPSLSLDTACSSSLAAVHLAIGSLRAGECEMALAGGVQVGLEFSHYLMLSRLSALSPTGRCRPFDRLADGYTPGEGVGMVLLKPLSKALADGDPIQGVLLGSAVGHGGQSAGLTVPCASAQADVIHRALHDAQASADSISYVEAHGTGTALGDPIEIAGLVEAFRSRTSRPQRCAVGSVKSNIAHLESAAGIAGLLKVLLALREKQLPPSLHVVEPNRAVDFEQSPFFLCDRLRKWDVAKGLRRAGISSFGFGGANAHLVVEEAPAISVDSSTLVRPKHLFAISAASPDALKDSARKFSKLLRAPMSPALADVCHTLVTGRAQLEYRLAAVADTKSELADHLAKFSDGHETHGCKIGRAGSAPPRVAMLFTGQGSQRPGTAELLYETQPTFREIIDRCAEILVGHLDRPLVELLTSLEVPASELNATANAQPALFALEIALFELWKSWGVRPSVVLGHSLGEYAAAVASGAMSFEDGLRLVARRGRLMQSLPPDGAMAVVFVGRETVEERLAAYQGRVCVAVVNSADNTVVSGESGALDQFLRQCKVDGIGVHRLSASHAFHSPMIEPALEGLQAAASQCVVQLPTIPFISNLTGSAMEIGPSADYWARHARQPVQFAAGVQSLDETGVDVFLEIGPAATLLGIARENLKEKKNQAFTPSLGVGLDDWQSILEALGELYCKGQSVDWIEFDRPYAARRIPLPTYPFQRQRYWIERSKRSPTADDASDWFHVPQWELIDAPIGEIVHSPSVGTWLIFCDDEGIGDLVADRLIQHGSRVLRIIAREGAFSQNGDEIAMDLREKSHWVSLREAADLKNRILAGVLYCRPLSKSNSPTAALEESIWSWTIALGQLIVTAETPPPIWFCTTTGAGRGIVGAALSATARAARLEDSRLRLRWIELADAERPISIEALWRELCDASGPTECRLFEQRRWTRRLALKAPDCDAPLPRRADGVYLITGGIGALGIQTARALAERGASHLILLSRRTLPPREEWPALRDSSSSRKEDLSVVRAVLDLEATGVRVELAVADVADESRMREVFASIRRRHGRLHGIVHAAGVLKDSLLRTATLDQLQDVLRPKVIGAQVLLDLTKEWNLDFVIFFSSLAAAEGNVGQGIYSAANAALDALAESTDRPDGTRVMSLGWGPWSEVGMAAGEGTRRRMEDLGWRLIDSNLGRTLFLWALEHPRFQWLVCRRIYEKQRDEQKRVLVAQPVDAPREERSSLPSVIIAGVRRIVAEVLKLPADQLENDRSFRELGVDSLASDEIARRLAELWGLEALRAPILYEAPTIDALASVLLKRYGDAIEGASQGPALTKTDELKAQGVRDHDVAIVGYSCRFPQAKNPEEFWTLLHEGRDVVGPMPQDRWRIAQALDPNLAKQFGADRPWGGFLADVEQFDPLFFKISPAEARQMDPRQRLFLEVAFEAAERAGHGGLSLEGTRTGVFVGSGASDAFAGAAAAELTEHTALGGTSAVIASRLAYYLDLRGPCMPIDTACSAGLVAVDLAMRALRSGECDFAFAGAVHLHWRLLQHLALKRMGALSPTGHCKPFDQSADGFTPSEGVGVLLLRPLHRALANGDTIYGVLRGSAVNNDGRSNGLSAPNPAAQRECLLEAWRDAKIDQAAISYLEAHGTGTVLGDPIELHAIADAFGRLTNHRQFCAVGSVKGNLGHTDAAAGIAGLIKVLESFRHDALPASLHLSTPNPRIDFAHGPVFPADRLRSWLRGEKPRIAGVSAFGFSGTNAHLVVQEPPLSVPTRHAGDDEPSTFLLPLSAPDRELLAEHIERYRIAVDVAEKDVADVCFTAALGRRHGTRRAVWIVDRTSSLNEQLKRMTPRDTQSLEIGDHAKVFLQTPASKSETAAARSALKVVCQRLSASTATLIRTWCRGQVVEEVLSDGPISNPSNSSSVHDDSNRRSLLVVVGGLYVLGAEVDWAALYAGQKRRRVNLPNSPMRRVRISNASESTSPIPSSPHRLIRIPNWKELIAVSESPQAHARRNWLIFEADSKALAEVISRLRTVGDHVATVVAGMTFERLNSNAYQIRPDQPEDYQRLLQALDGAEMRIDAALHAWLMEEQLDDDRALRLGVHTLIHWVQAWRKNQARPPLELKVLTHAQSITESEAAGVGAVRGLLRVLPLECSKIQCQSLEWGGAGEPSKHDLDVMSAELRRPIDALEVRIVQGKRFILHWKTPISDTQPRGPGLRRGGVFWITGGLGGVGLKLAERLFDQYAAKLVFIGRRPLEDQPGSFAAVASLRSRGAQVLTMAADVADESAMHEALKETITRFGELHGVFHLAGVVRKSHIDSTTIESFDDVLRPKLQGALALERVLRGRDLESFVLFSSVAGVTGNVFQADYSAASRALDCLAEFWRGRGLPALAIDWGLWRDIGMAAGLTELARQRGDLAMTPDEALDAMEEALSLDVARVQIAPEMTGQHLASPRLEKTARLTSAGSTTGWLAEILAQTLGLNIRSIDADASFVDLGMDSMLAVKFSKAISAACGKELSTTAPFDHPSLARLAKHVDSLGAVERSGAEIEKPPIARARSIMADRIILSSGRRILSFHPST